MIKVRKIFATRSDLMPGLLSFEIRDTIKYVRAGWSELYATRSFMSASEIPDLGRSKSKSVIAATRFLVLDRDLDIIVRTIPQQDGSAYHSVEYDDHPDAVAFMPGGLFDERRLIQGSISTSNQTTLSSARYTRFLRKVTKGFTKVYSYWVGPEALAMFNSGARLIRIGIDEPVEYDLDCTGFPDHR